MNKKYQVFVSSTYSDLKDERRAIIQTIMELDCIPSGMEAFPAADEEQMAFIKRVIDDCDYYIIVIGGRYGSIDEVGVSFTEKEYDYAVSKGMTVLAFICEDPGGLDPQKTDQNYDIKKKLDRFRDKVTSGRIVKMWRSASDLPGQVALSLARAMKVKPAVGWIRGNAVASDELIGELVKLRKENEELVERLQAAKKNEEVVPDLADLSHPIVISGSYKNVGSSVARTWELSTSCAEIFSLIAPEIVDCPADSRVSYKIVRALREKKSLQGESYTLNEQDYYTIRIQLETHGLVEVVRTSTVGGGVGVFWNLTDRGRQTMYQMRSLKKALDTE